MRRQHKRKNMKRIKDIEKKQLMDNLKLMGLTKMITGKLKSLDELMEEDKEKIELIRKKYR